MEYKILIKKGSKLQTKDVSMFKNIVNEFASKYQQQNQLRQH